MTEHTPDRDRAERAFGDWFAERAGTASFEALDPAVLVRAAGEGAARPSPRRRVPWRALGWAAAAAVATLAVVVAVVRPFGPAPTPSVVSAVPVAPGETGQWQQVATPPLGQRYGAITLWDGGAFYVVGGIAHCGLDERGNPARGEGYCRLSLPSPGKSLSDGARFDPASGAWTALADAPVAIGRGQGVVAGGALYVLPEAREDEAAKVLRYEPSTDRWTTLPQPADPSDKTITQLLGWGGELYAFTAITGCIDDDCRSIDRWDDAAGRWRQYLGEVTALRFGEGTLAAIEHGFVSLYSDGRGTQVRAAAFRDGEWVTLPAPPLKDVPQWLLAAGDVVVAITSTGEAYSLDVAAGGGWQRVVEPAGTGGLVGGDSHFGPRFSDGSRVVVGGRLYDPATGEWTVVPPLPYQQWTFGAFAGNGSQVLGCFVGPAGSMNDCYRLELGAATPGAPPVAVDEWVATAGTPLAPRTGAITVWTGEEFLVVGGRVCEGASTECAATDAAAYRPGTDRWRSVAAPPVALDDTVPWAVLQGRLYVLSASGEGFWGYDATGDRWIAYEAPGNATDAPTILEAGEVLLALGAGTAADEWFDPATASWHELPSGTYPAGPGRRAVFTGKELLVGSPGAQPGTLEFEVLFSAGDGRPPTDPSTEPLRPLDIGAGVELVVAESTTVAVPSVAGSDAWYRGGGGGEWVRVPVPETAGPLRDGLVVGFQVALGGRLFTPDNGTWRDLPGLPDGASAAVQAASEDVILSCFTVTGEGLGRGCYLLRE
ncbi:MAG TPA: hypothetical protein PLE12_10385 [Propionicimonas sp.]|nr:hypothetical protein [Propionicimonas sp.]